jgi:PleD family two-component response regulator
MEKLKGLKIVLLILLVVLVLVIVKTTGKNRFKQDAQNVIEAVKSNTYQVTMNDLKGTEDQYFIVDLSESGSVQFENSVKIQFEKLLDETTLQKLKETENKILLVADDNSVAVKAWIILNQLGFKNVFVLSGEENLEVLRYEFQPDTAAKLETISE